MTSIIDALTTELGGLITDTKEENGMKNIVVEASSAVEAVTKAKAAGFDMLSDVFGVDYLTYPQHKGKRFSVCYNLYSTEANERIFIWVNLDDGETLKTITHLWRGANFMERETYDMYGVEFEGHPDLRKLITPEDLDGHPLRKDFPIGESPTLFNDGRFLDPASFRAGMTGQSDRLSKPSMGRRSSKNTGGVN